MSGVRLVITSPLSDELVARIRATDARLDVVHEPDLLAPARHACDHPLPKVDDPAARERWNALLDGWREVFFGAETTRTFSAFEALEGVNASFTLARTTAWTGRRA